MIWKFSARVNQALLVMLKDKVTEGILIPSSANFGQTERQIQFGVRFTRRTIHNLVIQLCMTKAASTSYSTSTKTFTASEKFNQFGFLLQLQFCDVQT